MKQTRNEPEPSRQHVLTLIRCQHMLTEMEPFTGEAIAVLAQAREHAHRLGHRYIGAEHLLLAVTSTSQPAGAILRDYGVTPQRVEQEIVRYSGLGAGAGLFGGLDRDALAAVGIDLDTVRARIESSFGPEALTRAGQAARPALHRPRVRARLIRRLHRRREAAMAPIPLRAATGMWRSDRGSAVFLPFTRGVPEILRNIRPKARAQHDTSPDVDHIALAVLAVTSGPVPAILSSLGVTQLALRTAILGRDRRAS
jgi:Clp amino terminal domain, pathogenicity island component